MDESVANHATLGNQLWKDGLEDDDESGATLRGEIGARISAAKLREFNSLGVVLGYRYDRSPVTVEDGTATPSCDFLNYVPSARPGCLAPHAWLHDGTSLYDHFGAGFTLLVTDESSGDERERAQASAKAAGVPLKVLAPTDLALADLYRARFVLIRPDQHVAWRGDAWPADDSTLWMRVSGRSRSA